MTDEMRIIRLRDPLPCGIYAEPDEPCGRPAMVAYAFPINYQPGMHDGPGAWTVRPVCERCADAMAKVYEGDKALIE